LKLNFEQRSRWEKKARLQREALPDVIATNNHDSVKKTADHAEIETSTKEAETLNREEKTEKGSKKKSSKRKMTNSKPKKSKKKKNGKVRKDPSKPKRPISAYLFFAQQSRPKIKEKYPDLKGLEITRQVGQAWSEATPEEKAPFMELENKSKDEYRKGMEKWRRNQNLYSNNDYDDEESCIEIQDDENGDESHHSVDTEKKC
jgi:upstream-binding transcription factor